MNDTDKEPKPASVDFLQNLDPERRAFFEAVGSRGKDTRCGINHVLDDLARGKAGTSFKPEDE